MKLTQAQGPFDHFRVGIIWDLQKAESKVGTILQGKSGESPLPRNPPHFRQVSPTTLGVVELGSIQLQARQP